MKPKVILLTENKDFIKEIRGGGLFLSKKHTLVVQDGHDFEDYLELRKNRASVNV